MSLQRDPGVNDTVVPNFGKVELAHESGHEQDVTSKLYAQQTQHRPDERSADQEPQKEWHGDIFIEPGDEFSAAYKMAP